MARARRKKVDSWKTKDYYEILAPKMFGEVSLGETLSSDPKNLVGRTVKSTLKDITGDFSKQHIKLKFQIGEIRGSKAHTNFKGQSLSRDYMRSQIRRKTTRVEGVVDVYTREGYKIRATAIALAIGRAQTAQERLVRKAMFDVVRKSAKDENLEDFIQEVLKGRLPSKMQKKASKIYPLKRVEIKKIKVLEEPGKAKIEKPAAVEKEEEQPEVTEDKKD